MTFLPVMGMGPPGPDDPDEPEPTEEAELHIMLFPVISRTLLLEGETAQISTGG